MSSFEPRVETDGVSVVKSPDVALDTRLVAVVDPSAPRGSVTVDIQLGGVTIWRTNRIGGTADAVAQEALTEVALGLRDALTLARARGPRH